MLWVQAIGQSHDAPNSSAQTSGIHAASDDTLSVAVHVSPTDKTCLSPCYIYSLFWLAEAGHTVQ